MRFCITTTISKAMVLAAGLGTRLKPFTDRVPKPLIPLHGIPCIDFTWAILSQAGVDTGVVNVHAHADQMRAHVSSQREAFLPLRLQVSDEESLLLGSAGGIRKAIPFFRGEAFFALNADVLHLAPLRLLEARHQSLKMSHGVLMTLVLVSGDAAARASGEYREIFTNAESGLVTGFGTKKTGAVFFSGSAIYEPEAFAHLPLGAPSEFVPEVLEPAIRAGKVGFIESDALWLDLGSPELWYRAELRIRQLYNAGGLPDWLSKRLGQADPSLGGRFELGKNKIRLDDTVYEITNPDHP